MDIIWTWIMDLTQYVDPLIKYVKYLELLNQIPYGIFKQSITGGHAYGFNSLFGYSTILHIFISKVSISSYLISIIFVTELVTLLNSCITNCLSLLTCILFLT